MIKGFEGKLCEVLIDFVKVNSDFARLSDEDDSSLIENRILYLMKKQENFEVLSGLELMDYFYCRLVELYFEI